MPKELTQDRLRQLMSYDHETGNFLRLNSRGGESSKTIAGAIRPDGYRIIGIDYSQYLAHRLVWLYVYGHFPDFQVDHINHNKDDNRLINLRAATISENLANCRLRKDNTSGFKGVSLNKSGTWTAQISIRGKQTRIGSFKTKEAAHAAYLERAELEFGKFARSG